MNPELLEALQTIVEPAPLFVEYRLYYNEAGVITMFAEHSHPEGDNYIVLEDPDIFYKGNTLLLRVKDGKLIKINPIPERKQGLQRSTQGQKVVKGFAALPLLHGEEYSEVEYYDLKANN